MSALQDIELDRLSDLFAQGQLSNADEIVGLLRVELGERLEPQDNYLQPYLDLIARLNTVTRS